jgi:hypothetical protein
MPFHVFSFANENGVHDVATEWEASSTGSLVNLAEVYCEALKMEFGERGRFVLVGKH